MPVKSTIDHALAVRHLRSADPRFAAIIERVGDCTLGTDQDERGTERDHYGALLRAIIGQRISTAAARTIQARVIEYFEGEMPRPGQILNSATEDLRSLGLPYAKVAAMKDLAERVDSGSLVLEDLDQLPDAAVATELVAIKGIGQWTADMLLIFHLGRPDVLPVGDLALRNAAQIAYQLPRQPPPDRFFELAEVWRPWRSVASWYLWASLKNLPA